MNKNLAAKLRMGLMLILLVIVETVVLLALMGSSAPALWHIAN